MAATYQRALEHYRNGRHDGAIEACRALLMREPGELATMNLLGAAMVATGQQDAALAVLTEAARLGPDSVETLVNLAILHYERGDWPAATARLRQIAALDPQSPFAFVRLGTLAQEMGDFDACLRFLKRAVRLAPRSMENRHNLSVARMQVGDFHGAVTDLRAMVAGEPTSTLAYGNLGDTLLRLGRVPEAATAFHHALRTAPNDFVAQTGMSRCSQYWSAAAAAHSPAAPEGLVVRGPFATASGYAHMSRRFIQTMRDRQLPLHGIGVFGPESWEAEGMAAPVRAKAVLNFLIPFAVEPVPGLATVTLSMFEGTRIPPAWLALSQSTDLMIVPCESSRIAWAGRGYPESRLRVCPLGVDPESAALAAAPLAMEARDGRPVSSYRHRFLNVSDFIPRKNIDGVLRVWLRCTTAKDDAVLILKLGKDSTPQTQRNIATLVRQTEAFVGKRLKDAAPVVLVSQNLDEAEMTGLFRAANYYWSLSHGEGWDLPLSKAGAMGMGLIAPRHSAYLDYLDDSVARMIPAGEGPARQPYSREPWGPFFGLDWWEPDENAAAAILGDIIGGRDTTIPDARPHLLKNFTWRQATDRLLAILGDAGFLPHRY